jgi:phage terminase large subunit
LLRDRFEATYQAIRKLDKGAQGVIIDPATLISIDSECANLAALKSELCRVQRKRADNTLVQIESKEDMRRRGIPSPNMADALVMAFSNPPPSAKKLEPLKIDTRYIV